MPGRALERRRGVFQNGVHLLDRRFLQRPHQYVLQATLAAMTLGALVAVKDSISDAATATVIACSAVIIFTAPHLGVSGPRRVLGGHAVGLMIGILAHLVAHDVFTTVVAQDLTGAAAIGAGMLVMAATDTEHPPAAGTAFTLVLADDVLEPAVVIIVAVVMLTVARQFFRRWMIDLGP